MKKQVLFIHGAGLQDSHQGSADLVANLQEGLGVDYNLICPEMPAPDNPDCSEWKVELEKILNRLHGELILVGHSLGGSVLLKYLSEEAWDKSISGLFLVAAPFWGKGEEWNGNDFVLQEDFASRLSRIPRIFLYHSRDDDVVPFSHLKYYAKKLAGATVRALDGHGHYFRNADFHEIVADIKGVAKDRIEPRNKPRQKNV